MQLANHGLLGTFLPRRREHPRHIFHALALELAHSFTRYSETATLPPPEEEDVIQSAEGEGYPARPATA
jgi:hypothetical protein